jgi:hypothetical protein
MRMKNCSEMKFGCFKMIGGLVGFLMILAVPACGSDKEGTGGGSGSGTGGGTSGVPISGATEHIECRTRDASAKPFEVKAYHNQSVVENGHNAAFLFTKWCDRNVFDPKQCRCTGTVDSIRFAPIENLPWGDTIVGKWRILTDQGWSFVNIKFKLDPLVLASNIIGPNGWIPKIIDSTVVSLKLPGMWDPSTLTMTPGGLCVIDNIDGGDGGFTAFQQQR